MGTIKSVQYYTRQDRKFIKVEKTDGCILRFSEKEMALYIDGLILTKGEITKILTLAAYELEGKRYNMADKRIAEKLFNELFEALKSTVHSLVPTSVGFALEGHLGIKVRMSDGVTIKFHKGKMDLLMKRCILSQDQLALAVELGCKSVMNIPGENKYEMAQDLFAEFHCQVDALPVAC